MTPRDPLLLEHMLENARIAMDTVQDLDAAAFCAQVAPRYTTLHAVQIIGEAAGKLSEAAKARLPGVPWRDVVAVRNIIVHAYHSVDPSTVYAIVKERLPELAEAVAALLKEAPPP